MRKLVGFAESTVNPLSSYAVGVLADCMEDQDFAASFKDNNARLVRTTTCTWCQAVDCANGSWRTTRIYHLILRMVMIGTFAHVEAL